MYTSMMVLALSTLNASVASESPTWRTDYAAARKEAAATQKPMAVFVGSGSKGWEKLSQKGHLTAAAQKALASAYIPVYVNNATAEGKRLAAALELPAGLGIVISDSTGQLQAFYHEGNLADTALQRYLQKFSDPQRPVLTTETNPPAVQSTYYLVGSMGLQAGCTTCGGGTAMGGCSSCGGCGDMGCSISCGGRHHRMGHRGGRCGGGRRGCR
jgi:hypothetical protein